MDDADFCTRVKRQGFRCLYAHRAVLYHMVAYTTGGYSAESQLPVRPQRRHLRPALRQTLELAHLARLHRRRPAGGLAARARKGNQAAATAKLKGIREGMRIRDPATSAAHFTCLSQSSRDR